MPLTSDKPRCLSSFEIAELLLLLGAKKLVDCGIIMRAFATISLASRLASVSARALTCFSSYVFTGKCKQLLWCSPKLPSSKA